MKQLLLSLLAMLFFYPNAYAHAPINPVACPHPQIVHCPESITCTKDGDINSCTFRSDHPEYWDELWATSWVSSGEHKLAEVTAFLQPKIVQQATCIYNEKNPITLSSKKEANLEISKEHKDSKWIINDDGFGYCAAKNANSCLLSQHSTLVINNTNIPEGVTVSVNGERIIDTVSSINNYGKVSYDNALAHCSNQEICKLDIISPQGAAYGYVYVDVNKHMKIISTHDWKPSDVNIIQVAGLNAIRVSYPFFIAQK